ncbi:hypothetical protein [Enterococcus olivae]
MKPNLGFYVQKINDIVKDTEAIGEEMNPCFEEIRQAIDEDKTAEISEEKRNEIVKVFEEGTKKYQAMKTTIAALRPPARVMGIHKKFERSYFEYVEGCEEMIASLSEGVDAAAFNAAEAKQDEATDTIAFSIQRMTGLLLKR